MHIFDYGFLTQSIPSELARAAALVSGLRASNALRVAESPDAFEALREAAVIESVRGSNAIEGIVTTRARLEGILRGEVGPESHGEREILGYRRALDEMYAPGFDADLTEEYICHLHGLLLGASSPEAGKYKRSDNWIQQRDADGRISVRFVPVAAKVTPDAMAQLVMAYRDARQNSAVDPLALIACVVLDFLCIHPFADGNGRVSRLLTTMLLEREGFDIGRYVSLEGKVDEYKTGYYDALAAASVGWHDGEGDYIPFVTFMLQVVYACYKELDQRFVEDSLRRVPKTELVERVLMDAYVPMSKAEVCERLPEVSAKTVQRVIARMVDEGRLEKIGTYRDARYRRV